MGPIQLIKAGLRARKAFRVWNNGRKRRKQRTSELLDEDIVMQPQKIQGKLTHSSALVVFLSYMLDAFNVVPEGYDSITAAGVLAGLIGVVYGRIRREWRA